MRLFLHDFAKIRDSGFWGYSVSLTPVPRKPDVGLYAGQAHLPLMVVGASCLDNHVLQDDPISCQPCCRLLFFFSLSLARGLHVGYAGLLLLLLFSALGRKVGGDRFAIPSRSVFFFLHGSGCWLNV